MVKRSKLPLLIIFSPLRRRSFGTSRNPSQGTNVCWGGLRDESERLRQSLTYSHFTRLFWLRRVILFLSRCEEHLITIASLPIRAIRFTVVPDPMSEGCVHFLRASPKRTTFSVFALKNILQTYKASSSRSFTQYSRMT